MCCIYVRRVIRSFGLCLLSLLGSSASSSSVVAISFGCPVILSLYFRLMFVISSRTVGMPRSACSILFGTYHGALTIARRT
jgi:hypothetical protein